MKEHKKEILHLLAAAVLLAAGCGLNAVLALPAWGRILLFAVPYAAAGGEIFVEAVTRLFRGQVLAEEFLMVLASLGAFAVGEYPEAVFVLLFFSVGELFEEIATERSHRSIEALAALRSESVTVETPDGPQDLPPEAVAVGAVITVCPGDRIPLDGVIVSGESAVDASALTGESLPVACAAGDAVQSGCVNLSGVLHIRVSRIAAESTVAKILRLVEQATEKKSRPERFISRFAAVYTPIVVLLAVLLAVLLPLVGFTFTEGLRRACMFLVVSCPCALVVSVPLSYFCGMGGASKKGILIKGAGVLESLARVKTVVLDKTGTLTYGRFQVTAVHPQAVSERELLRLACLAECYSNHPISVSLRAVCADEICPTAVADVRECAGFGVEALVEGQAVAVGNTRLMERLGLACPQCPHPGTVVHVAVAGVYAGHIAVADEVKTDSAAAVAALHDLGVHTVLLTGDRAAAAEAVASAVGITEWQAQLLPGDKVAQLEKILQRPAAGSVLFAGDGMNDAPVLARADVGVAMGAFGSEAAVEAADAVLSDDNPAKLPTVIKIARKTARIVRQNIVASLLIKLAVMGLVTAGRCSFWLASFADVGVLILAVCNATRAFYLREK